MEPAKPDLIEVGRSIREAFDAEDNAVEALRGGRARLLEKIAMRNVARSLRPASSLRRRTRRGAGREGGPCRR